MADVEISERAILFEYGFLTSRTNRVLSKIMKTGNLVLDARDRETIEHAKDFIDKILKERKFLSGELKEGMIPDFDRLTTFNRALNTLDAIGKLPGTSEEIRRYFEEIKDGLNSILDSSLKDVRSLKPTNSFFSAIADILLEELNSMPEPSSTFR